MKFCSATKRSKDVLSLQVKGSNVCLIQNFVREFNKVTEVNVSRHLLDQGGPKLCCSMGSRLCKKKSRAKEVDSHNYIIS